MPATRTATASARYTSTPWRVSGHCSAPGCVRIAASRRRSCQSTSASLSSCTTRAGAEKPCSVPLSLPWSGDVLHHPGSRQEPLGIVARMCDKLAVMYAGKIVEAGSVRTLFNSGLHPYTKALLGSMPKLGSKEKLLAIPGQPPDLATLPPGCAFHPRCPEALPQCSSKQPPEVPLAASWSARCWLAERADAPDIGNPCSTDYPEDRHAAAAAGN